jgi:L-threonylcarbamoyladenylate synthase
LSELHLKLASRILWAGGIIAYPTEAVWGLGCDPWDEAACLHLLQIKDRPVEKGMILIAADMEQIDFLLAPLSNEQRDEMQKTWPGPTTWLVPDSLNQIPGWIRGEHSSVAVRVSAHPGVQALCRAFGGPLVSTSANPAGARPARTRLQVVRTLPELDYILPGMLGKEAQPSTIIDLLSGRVMR